MAKQDVITKLYRLENKEYGRWTEKKIGAEASNVYVRTGQGGAIPAQSLLLNSTPPATYQYGQDLWDANNQVFEALTWDNIQKWLNEGRINDFLKEGDCIEVTTDIIEYGTQYLKWRFYVIGINRHNGQDMTNLSLDHIDFCGGSMDQLSKRFCDKNNFSRSNYNFADMPSNNGGAEGGENSYGNYFTDGLFSRLAETTSTQCLEEICKDNINIADKKMFLDARYRPKLDFMTVWGQNNAESLIATLADVWRSMQEGTPSQGGEEEGLDPYYNIFYTRFTEEGGVLATYPANSGGALAALRCSIGQLTDDFLKDAGVEDSSFALAFLRLSAGIGLPTPEEITAPSAFMNDTLKDCFYKMCKTAAKWQVGGIYSVTSKKANAYASLPLWSLTEKEFFGECTFSNAEYAQGQIFQYPIFNNLSYRQKVTQSLSRSIGGVCNMVTLTPVENSNSLVAGMDPNTLMPTEASILKTSNYTPDTPICFRIQQDS